MIEKGMYAPADRRQGMFEVIFIAVLAAFAAGGIWAYVVTKKVKKEGIETDAVVSRVELHEWGSGVGEDEGMQRSVTEEYYITYTNQEGLAVEAMLTNEGSHTFKEVDRNHKPLRRCRYRVSLKGRILTGGQENEQSTSSEREREPARMYGSRA